MDQEFDSFTAGSTVPTLDVLITTPVSSISISMTNTTGKPEVEFTYTGATTSKHAGPTASVLSVRLLLSLLHMLLDTWLKKSPAGKLISIIRVTLQSLQQCLDDPESVDHGSTSSKTTLPPTTKS